MNSGKTNIFLLLQNHLIASNHQHYPLSSCFCSLLIPVSVLQHPDAKFNQSKSLKQLLLRLSFASFFKNTLRQNFYNIFERELLFMVIQQAEEVFGIVRTNLRALLNLLGLGTNGIRAERRKSRRRNYGGCLHCKPQSK